MDKSWDLKINSWTRLREGTYKSSSSLCCTVGSCWLPSLYIVMCEVVSLPLEKEMTTHSSIFLPGKPMDQGAWWATVHGVAKSRTQLNDWARTHMCKSCTLKEKIKHGTKEKCTITSLCLKNVNAIKYFYIRVIIYLIAIGGRISPFKDSEDSARYYKYDSFRKKNNLIIC